MVQLTSSKHITPVPHQSNPPAIALARPPSASPQANAGRAQARRAGLPAIALARPPSASPQANAGRAQARRAGIPIGAKSLSSAGFTLIEVLIATMILSFVIYLGTLSYSMFLDVWGKKRVTDINAINDYRYHILLKSALESVYDYYVTDPANEKRGFYYPLFKGEREKIEFVTLSSVFQKGLPAVARIRLERHEEKQDLIYEEIPLDKAYIRYSNFQLEYKKQMVAFSNAKSINIRYYGEWETKFVPGTMDFETIYKWQETFHGRERKTIPEKIEIAVSGRDGEKKLLFPIRARNIFKRGFFQREY